MMRNALLLCYTSWRPCKLLLQQFTLTSVSLLKKITSGFIDSVKSAKLLLEKETMSELEKEPMSEDCVLLVDENVFAKVSTVLQ